MSFTLNPAFSFNLNRILVGTVKFGRFDGIHVCLTAVTSTDKVILHNPYKRLSESNNRLSWSDSSSDVAVLNFNQEIRAIETGCLSTTDTKDVLVIGSPTQLLSMDLIDFSNNCFWISMGCWDIFFMNENIWLILCGCAAYHVDSNKDIFFKEIMEGIQTILIGVAGTFETPLVFVGGNRKPRLFHSLPRFFFCLFTWILKWTFDLRVFISFGVCVIIRIFTWLRYWWQWKTLDRNQRQCEFVGIDRC